MWHSISVWYKFSDNLINDEKRNTENNDTQESERVYTLVYSTDSALKW